MTGMGRQLRDNLVAITSLVVALSALGYNTWRNERTERNRNIRTAGSRKSSSATAVRFNASTGPSTTCAKRRLRRCASSSSAKSG
jgi:hypothetical protein